MNGTEANGKRTVLSRETLVPWGAALAFASLAMWGTSKYGDLEKTVERVAAKSAADVQEQGKQVALELQSLKMTVEYQGRDLAELKKSVDAMTRGAGK